MKLTPEYINSHRTAKHAFTRRQIEALGLEWPPSKGWINSLAGKEITEEQARQFEGGKSQYNTGKGKPTEKQLQSNVNFICKNVNSLSADQIMKLLSYLTGKSGGKNG